MQLTIERGVLLKALNHVTSVVESRTTIPILTHIRMEARGDELQLKATDLDIEITEIVKADPSAPGAVAVSAKMIYNIVRKLPDGCQIKLATAKDGRMTVSAGRSRFSLASLPAGDFPDLGVTPMPHVFDLPARSLAKLIDRTRFAISTEETRYYLNGIFLHAHNEQRYEGVHSTLRAVATDGHRLARKDVELPDGAGGMPGVIIPRKTVEEVYKLIADHDVDVRVGVSDNKISIDIGEDRGPRVRLISKLIEGQFPDYARVIPAGNDKVLSVACTDFIRSVDRVSLMAAEKGRGVKLSMSDGALNLSTSSMESGSADEELAATWDDAPLEIGFNGRYMLDVAQQIEGAQMLFMLSDPSSPAIIRDNGDPAALYVIMPMRV